MSQEVVPKLSMSATTWASGKDTGSESASQGRGWERVRFCFSPRPGRWFTTFEMDRSRALSSWPASLASLWELVRNTDTQAPSRLPGSGSAGSSRDPSRAHSSLRSSASQLTWDSSLEREWERVGGRLLLCCFQKPRKGHRYSFSDAKCLGVPICWGVFLTCTKRLPVTMWYGSALFLFKSLQCKKINTAISFSWLPCKTFHCDGLCVIKGSLEKQSQ